jgi:hypothetical protein
MLTITKVNNIEENKLPEFKRDMAHMFVEKTEAEMAFFSRQPSHSLLKY